MHTYERVTFRPEVDGKPGRARSVYLEDPRELDWHLAGIGTPMLSGREVAKDSTSILYTGDRTRLIQRSLIVKREPYEMDLQYGELVPLGTATVRVEG